MKVGDSARLAIDEWARGEVESAMLHACNAVDGTARKAYPKIPSNKERFTRLLRDNYSILGPMGAPGINLIDSRFSVDVKNPTARAGYLTSPMRFMAYIAVRTVTGMSYLMGLSWYLTRQVHLGTREWRGSLGSAAFLIG